MRILLLKHDDFIGLYGLPGTALPVMNFVYEMMDFVVKMMDFVAKMMDFVLKLTVLMEISRCKVCRKYQAHSPSRRGFQADF